jgi:hypothetical protein
MFAIIINKKLFYKIIREEGLANMNKPYHKILKSPLK